MLSAFVGVFCSITTANTAVITGMADLHASMAHQSLAWLGTLITWESVTRKHSENIPTMQVSRNVRQGRFSVTALKLRNTCTKVARVPVQNARHT